jgi:MoaA/NifB/PqqE/SkfB family radical SAM enzyme
MLSSLRKFANSAWPPGAKAGSAQRKRIKFTYGEVFVLPWFDFVEKGDAPLAALELVEMVRRDEVDCPEPLETFLRPYRTFAASGLPLRPDVEQGLHVVSTLFDAGARLPEHTLSLVEKVVAKLTPAEVAALTGEDRWLRNFLMNLWEFGNGVDTLTSYPWNISLPIADICNARCTFCTSWFEGKALVKLSQIENFADVIAHSIYIGLVGHGEPMAHPQFDKICEIIERHMDPRATAYTITNGVFLKKWGDLLDRINLRSVSISLNAATAETHNEVMGLGEDAFLEILEGIRRLTSRGMNGQDRMISITMVVTQQNVHEIPAFIALGEALGVNQVWLRSLLPQAHLTAGLNYHTLAPTLHPNYPEHRRNAVAAIAAAKIPVQADPNLWDQEVFPPNLRDEIRRNPPPFVTREETMRDKALRRQTNVRYQADGNQLRGAPLKNADFTRVLFRNERAEIETRTLPWSYALRFAIAPPADKAGKARVIFRAEDVKGYMGFGLLSIKANDWITRVLADKPGSYDIVLEFDAPYEGGVDLVIHNGETDNATSSCTITAPRIEVDAAEGTWSAQLAITQGLVDAPADPLEDGLNPFDRRPRFACKAPYYNLYVNEMYYRVVPCCFMQTTPGFEEIRFDGSRPFMDAWNAPSMVELRRRLRDGPLFGACKKCPEKW